MTLSNTLHLFTTKIFLVRIVSITVLALATFMFFRYAEFYQDTGNNLLVNGVVLLKPWNESSLAGINSADFSHLVNGASIENNDPLQSVQIAYIIPVPVGQYVRAKISLSVDNILPADKPWKAARAIIISGDNGEWFNKTPHQLAVLSGSIPFREYSLVAPIPEQATEMRFAVQILKTTGRVSIDQTSLTVVEKDSFVEACVKGLMLLWVFIAIWVIFPLLTSWHGRFVALFGFGVLTLILVPKTNKLEILRIFRMGLVQAELPESWLGGMALSSVGHFFMFLFLSLISLKLFRKHFTGVFFLLLGLALLSEILQNFAIGRVASLNDLGIDLLGICVAAGLIKLFSHNWKHGPIT